MVTRGKGTEGVEEVEILINGETYLERSEVGTIGEPK